MNECKNSENRIDKLRKILSNKMPEKYAQKLLSLCSDYNDIFCMDDDTLTTNNFYDQKINLKD